PRGARGRAPSPNCAIENSSTAAALVQALELPSAWFTDLFAICYLLFVILNEPKRIQLGGASLNS
ncbi:MAG: hypothetical protein WAM44_02435, partial [Chthoniobacterales bacterium]